MKLYLEDDNGKTVPITEVEHFEFGKANCLIMKSVYVLKDHDRLRLQEELSNEIGIKVVIISNMFDKIMAVQ